MVNYDELPPSVFKSAWLELAKCFGERQQQEELDLMDSVLKGVELDMEGKEVPFSWRKILRQFPHLATKKSDKEEL